MVDGLVDRATPVGEIIVEWGGLIAGWVSNPFHAAPTLERYLPFVWCVCLYGNMCVCVCLYSLLVEMPVVTVPLSNMLVQYLFNTPLVHCWLCCAWLDGDVVGVGCVCTSCSMFGHNLNELSLVRSARSFFLCPVRLCFESWNSIIFPETHKGFP